MNYSSMSVSIFKKVLQSFEEKDSGDISLLMSKKQLQSWISGITPVKTTTLLKLINDSGTPINDLVYTLTAPQELKSYLGPVTRTTINNHLLSSLLKKLRGDHSLKEVAKGLNLKSPATFNHWENGTREIPFPMFLMFLGKYTTRLPNFIEAFDLELDEINGVKQRIREKFSSRFFENPWTPTVYLALQTHAQEKEVFRNLKKVRKTTGLTEGQVDESIGILINLGLVRISKGQLSVTKGQFYAPPALSKKRVGEIHNYWFGQSQNLCNKTDGFHRVEQHALSFKSKEKIIGWISELREKIKNEVKQTEPETVVHINWQIADLMNSRPPRETR